jgi:hypothetical protein
MLINGGEELLRSTPVSEGAWIKTENLLAPFSLMAFNFATADRVQIYLTNDATLGAAAAVAPVAGDGSIKLGADISVDGSVVVTSPWRYIRARKSAVDNAPVETVVQLYGTYSN